MVDGKPKHTLFVYKRLDTKITHRVQVVVIEQAKGHL